MRWHFEQPYQDLRCLQIQLFSSLVVKELKNLLLELTLIEAGNINENGRVASPENVMHSFT